MLRRFVILMLCVATQVGCRGTLVVEQFGAMREVMRDGQTEARITLQQAAGPGAIAIGALENLAGEITMLDGQVWVARVADDGAVQVSGPTADPADAATLLTLARVPSWQNVAVDHPIAEGDLEDVVEQAAIARGLDTSQPFPFVIDTDAAELDLHVINGYCPIASDPETTDNAPWRDTLTGTKTRLVGFFAPNAAGVMTHHGTSLHVHALVVLGDRMIAGHVDRVVISGAARLRIPVN